MEASFQNHINTTCCLLHRSFKLCSNFDVFHKEIDKLKTICESNSYPKSFVDLCIIKYRKKHKFWKQKLKIIFQSPCKLSSLFRYKDSLKKETCSGIVYKYTCSNCKVTYFGKKYHHSFTRAAEDMGISNLTRKHLKSVKQSAISDRLLELGTLDQK